MKRSREKGITLIALVITIIVLIILAGVSMNLVLGEDGIISKAKLATEKTKISTEKEKIQILLLENAMGNGEYIGKKLYDKTIENGNKWNIIVTKVDNKVYGTGYSFIPKNTELKNYGATEYNYLIDEKTLEIVKLKDNEYVEISYDSGIGVTDNLIFNMDSSIIDNANSSEIEEKLGDNVKLINFNWNDDSGLTKTSFNLDGVDDYIKIEYDTDEEKQALAQNGFTFEFYGVLDGGTSYNASQEIIDNYGYKGMFCYWNGIESKQAQFRFGLTNYGKNIVWNAGSTVKNVSDYSKANAPWNIEYPEIEEIDKGKEMYITITLDTANTYTKDGEEYYTHALYINGKKMFFGGYNKATWDAFIENDLSALNYFCVGRSSMTEDGNWHYSKMNAYTLRLYNKALTEEEVSQNYDKSIQYHNLLVNEE